jgi:RNase P/RNase MRP subunit p29
MQDLLTKLIGKEIDVMCSGAASLRGKVVNVEDSVLQIEDEDGQIGYIAIDKIVAVWEKRDKDRHPGFVFKS